MGQENHVENKAEFLKHFAIGPVQRFTYHLVCWAFRCFLPIYFRGRLVLQESEGQFRRIKPPTNVGPRTLIVANHSNSLLDCLILLLSFREIVRFVAMHILWSYPLVRYFLWMGGTIPVFRPQDKDKMAKRKGVTRYLESNSQVMAVVQDAFSRYPVAIFPEGTTHLEGKMKPFKTGPARFLAQAMQHDAGKSDHPEYKYLPSVIYYRGHKDFAAQCLLVLGQSVIVQPFSVDSDDAKVKIKEIRDSMERDVARLIPEYEKDETKKALDRALQLAYGSDNDVGVYYYFEMEFSRRLARMDRAEVEAFTQKLESIFENIDSIEETVGVSDWRWINPVGGLFRRRNAGIRKSIRMAIAPLTILALLIHEPLLRLFSWLSDVLTTWEVEKQTFKALGAFFLFPFYWGLLGLLSSRFLISFPFSSLVYAVGFFFLGMLGVRFRRDALATWRAVRLFWSVPAWKAIGDFKELRKEVRTTLLMFLHPDIDYRLSGAVKRSEVRSWRDYQARFKGQDVLEDWI